MNEVHTSSAPTRLSRETRHLLMAATIALVLLWVLARIRFPERPITPNPIPPLITQLSGRPGYADLASEVARAQSRLSGSLVQIPRAAFPRDGGIALRLRGESAIALMSDAERAAADDPSSLVAVDRPTGLTVLRVQAGSPVLGPAPWAPDRLDVPRYFLAAVSASDSAGVALRPVYVGSLQPSMSPAWSGPIWRIPPSTEVVAGTWLFTGEGELAGLVTTDAGAAAIVPGEILLSDAQRLVERRDAAAAGELGFSAQALSPQLSAATGASSGVIVTYVHPRGPAATKLGIGDVIETIGGVPIESINQWQVAAGRLAAGDLVELGVRRREEFRMLALTAAPAKTAAREELGLTLRWVANIGTEVVRVDPGSAAGIAGVRAGDVVTAFGSIARPTPAQIRRTFAAASPERPIILGLARGETHQVTAVVK
jgi:hypothetical protein